MASTICETELKPQFGAAVRTGGISRRLPVLRWLFLTLIFSLLWFREFSSADGPRSFIYLESWGGFRLADFLVLGLVYLHLLWILGTRQPLPKIPRILKKPALLSLAALGISVFWGVYQGGSHVYFDWRDIFLAAGLALVLGCWVRTPAALLEALYIFTLVMGSLVLYVLAGYVIGTRSVLTVIPGLVTPLYDATTLSCAVLLTLFAFRFAPIERSPLRRTVWIAFGSAAFLLVLLSFRRTMWGDLAAGALVLAGLQRKRRLLLFALIGVIGALILGLGGSRVYQRLESFNPFAAGATEYTNTNEDHANEVLDAFDELRQHPVLGIGQGRTFRTPRVSDWKAESFGVHNGLLHMWLTYSILGLLAYLWFHASLFRWLLRLQATHRHPQVRAFAQVGLAFFIGPFLASFGFGGFPYAALNHNMLVFFIIGGLLFLQPVAARSATA